MHRPHVTAALLAIALGSGLVARSLDDSEPEALDVPTPPIQISTPVVETFPAPIPRSPAVDETCDGVPAVVVAQELSASMIHAPRLDGDSLTAALTEVRHAMADTAFGAVGFAQQALTVDGTPTAEATGKAWVPLGSGADLTLPADPNALIGMCANVALGFEQAIASLRSHHGPRTMWLVVDGLHDCDAKGRFAYTDLAPLADAAAAMEIDVSVLLVEGWSDRRPPTPLELLVRGRGRFVRTAPWDFEEGLRDLAADVDPACR